MSIRPPQIASKHGQLHFHSFQKIVATPLIYSMLWRALASVEIPYTLCVTLDLFVYEKRPSFYISRLPLIIIASPPGGGVT